MDQTYWERNQNSNALSSRSLQKMAARQTAAEVFEEKMNESQIIDKSHKFPRFALEELRLGKKLGEGGFGTVTEIRGFDLSMELHDSSNSGRVSVSSSTRNGSFVKAPMTSLSRQSTSATIPDTSSVSSVEDTGSADIEVQSRKFIARHCMKNGKEARYAIKKLSPQTVQNCDKLARGLLDMALEARFLSSLKHHPNIIKVRGFAQGPRIHEDFFIVLDRLYDTLEQRLGQWKGKHKRLNALSKCMIYDRNGKQRSKLWEQRLHAAYDLSSALAHLHEQNVIPS